MCIQKNNLYKIRIYCNFPNYTYNDTCIYNNYICTNYRNLYCKLCTKKIEENNYISTFFFHLNKCFIY
ncbi:hypothetical protein MYSEV_287 [Mythimna separata entomopoxvirus 'L']|uniref:Uncharacterized protein n=1 Tax=Mythimna separata entomopoxvirus 'L' TaxID=1293572 RepID=A0A916P288_9POXV|nr:hypothetical protein MYSEV_287 [Mythimna separata entomopoxvirus 'L']CCU56485.1 hypothetical protein MYSEV_287 [Mythimna separata entomopoxvirus 'L']